MPGDRMLNISLCWSALSFCLHKCKISQSQSADQGWEYLILKTQLLCIHIWCGFRWRLKVSLSLSCSISHCALACRMMNLYTWCWCQREWGTDGALRSEERLRTAIGRRMQPNTITDIHSLFLQLNYEYRTMYFWIGKWERDGEVIASHCWHLDFFLCLQNTRQTSPFMLSVYVFKQTECKLLFCISKWPHKNAKTLDMEQMKLKGFLGNEK